MPTITPDLELLTVINRLIDECGGSQAGVARLLGMSRLRISRLLRQKGSVTERVRREFWNALQAASEAAYPRSSSPKLEPIQVIRDIDRVAIQVLQFLMEAAQSRSQRDGNADRD